jgi:hypothetical protein
MIEKGLLERGHRIRAAFETFDRLDAAARHLPHGHEAGTDLASVEQDRAGTAIAGIAANLRSGEAEVVAQGRRQPRDWRAIPARRVSVEGEFQLHAATFDRSRRSKTRAASLR